MARRASWLAAAALAIAAPAGCGGDDGRTPVTVALDFTPNAAHAGVYAAVREQRDKAHGLELRIRPPVGSAPDALKLLTLGRADLAVQDIHDLGLARERGADIVAVGALVQRPLAAIIARSDVRRPRDLAGRRVGVSGLPSDPAVLRAVVEDDGGDYSAIRQVTIGFAAVGALIERRVAAVPAFWSVEGATLRERGVKIRVFKVDDYGAPPYPEVVLVTTRKLLETRRDRIKAALAAIAEGTRSVIRRPKPAIREITRVSEGDTPLVRAQMRALLPVFRPSLALNRGVLKRWAAWDARIGILEKRVDVKRAFDFTLARR